MKSSLKTSLRGRTADTSYFPPSSTLTADALASTYTVYLEVAVSLPSPYTIYSLYSPAVVGAFIVFSSPAAFVILLPSTNSVVPAGANQTVSSGFNKPLRFRVSPLPISTFEASSNSVSAMRLFGII